MRFEPLGNDQLDHAEIGGLAVDLDARILGRTGLLLISGQEGVLERDHQLLGLDALLVSERVHRIQDLA